MYKQVIVLRNDLGMSRGKLVAQGAHAALNAYLHSDAQVSTPWLQSGQSKICLMVNSEQELWELYNKIRSTTLSCYLVQDAGKTELKPGTPTALAIGPDNSTFIDEFTLGLKLF